MHEVFYRNRPDMLEENVLYGSKGIKKSLNKMEAIEINCQGGRDGKIFPSILAPRVGGTRRTAAAARRKSAVGVPDLQLCPPILFQIRKGVKM